MSAWWETIAGSLDLAIGSWGVEIVAGLLWGSVACGLTPWWWARILISVGGSYVYERWMDPNKWSARDFLQRLVGLAIALAFWILR